MINLSDILDILWNIFKTLLISAIIIFALLGIVFIDECKNIPSEIKYYENGINIDAIEYHNNIYIKKGE